MADLLECLIQIKGIADTPRRLAERAARLAAASAAPADTERRVREAAGRLVAAELVYSDCLSRMLAEDRPALRALPVLAAAPDRFVSSADAIAEFKRRRAESVEILDRCSAAQLNRVGIAPSRRRMTVADLVALMLAHDTDCLGELFRL
jgi:hypothetical protein